MSDYQNDSEKVKNSLLGCFTFFILLTAVLLTFVSGGPMTFRLIFILFQLMFIYGIITIVVKIIKSFRQIKNSTNSEGSESRTDSTTHRTKTPAQAQESTFPTLEDEEDEEFKEMPRSFKDNSKEITMQLDVLKAFETLGLTPQSSFTKVNERYYELVKKINQKKMDESKRQKELEKLNKAFEILYEYYSKNA